MNEQSKSCMTQDLNSRSSPSKTTAPEKSKKKRKKPRRSKKGLPMVNPQRLGAFKEQEAWKEIISKLRKDLKNARPLIDDEAPMLQVSDIYNPDFLRTIRTNLATTFDANKLIVQNLYEMNFLEGKTDTFAYRTSKMQSTNYSTRRKDAKSIEKQNLSLSKTILSAKSTMKTVKDYAIEWKEIEINMENSARYPLYWKVKKQTADPIQVAPPDASFQQLVTEKSAKYHDKRPRVFMEISVDKIGVVGKMVAVLFSDYVPMTVKNFLAFCDPQAPQTYKGNLIFLIFQGYFCHTGDVVENRGYGGTSIYGPYFGNEDHTLKHGQRGVLTMYNRAPNRNDSQFLITFRKLESLDGENVVFGKIIKGLHVLDTIEGLGTKCSGRPKVEVFISDIDEI